MEGIRRRRSTAPGALLALVLLGPTAAAGQSATTTRAFRELQQTAASDAGRRLEKGRDALDGMRFAEAVPLLTEAIEFYRTADLEQHRASLIEAHGLLAAAHLFSGEEAEARNTLRALFTADEDWDLPVERRSPKLGQLIDAVRSELGSLQRGALQLGSSPEGARVFLDGVLLGKTPLVTEPILPGRHIVALVRKGSVPRQEVIFVGPGTALEWPLAEDPEAALVTAPPPKPRTFWGKHRGKVLLGTAGLGAGATALMLWRARILAADAALIPQPEIDAYDRKAGAARSLNAGGHAALYFSVTAAALGTYYLFTDGEPESVQAGVTPLPGGGAVIVGGRF